ncbi:MAG: endonuclease/exonuclease/phosphatase family protein [Casimicrobiaceae bacterium]
MKLLSWNVQWFRGLDGVVDVARVIGHAQTVVDFDLLCLQEVSDNFPGLPGCNGANQSLEVAHHLPGFTVHFAPGVDDLAPDGLSRRRFGNLIASRHPVAWLRTHALPAPHDAHTPSAPAMPRVALEAMILAPHGPLRVITTHLEYYHPAQRLAQAEAIARIAAEGESAARHPPAADEAGGPFAARVQSLHTVVCGDMNDAPGSATHAAMQSMGLRDAWPLAHPDRPQPPTFRLHEQEEGKPPIACDWIMVSASLARHVREIDSDSMTMLSDHQPVWIELGF